jgi:hypothetical protein
MMSGTIILCDKVYTTAAGQYVIAGTYTTWTVPVRDLAKAQYSFGSGLNFYLRFRPERTGAIKLQVQIKDENRQVWDQSWLTSEIEVPVPEQQPRLVEMALTTPAFTVEVRGAKEPDKDRVVLRNSVELSVAGVLVATTPFDVVFVRRGSAA